MTRVTRGYTLVELIVSVGLFSVVMLVATAAYLTMISLDRQTRGVNDVVNNLNFAVDSMARSIRTGTNYSCGVSGGNCWSSGASQFSFLDSQGRTITYLLTTNPTGTHGIGRCTSSPCTSSSATLITDPRIDISTTNGLVFYVKGIGSLSGTNDIDQPQVVMIIRGTMVVDSRSQPVSFSMETMAVQRLLDL